MWYEQMKERPSTTIFMPWKSVKVHAKKNAPLAKHFEYKEKN